MKTNKKSHAWKILWLLWGRKKAESVDDDIDLCLNIIDKYLSKYDLIQKKRK